MRFMFMIGTVVLAALPVVAQEAVAPYETPSAIDEQRLSDIGADFKAISRMAEFCDNLGPCLKVIRKIVDQDLELLREPRGDGSYRWAGLQRVEANRTSAEGEIVKVHSEGELSTIEVSGNRVYSVVISAPRKRTIFSSNSKVFVRDLQVEAKGLAGATRTFEIPVGVWIEPEKTETVPLPDIALSARVKANIGVETGNTKAVANVALLEAKLIDDPLNPYHPAVRRLNAISEIVGEQNPDRGRLRTVSNEAVLDLPGEMERLVALRDEELARLRRESRAAEEPDTLPVTIGDATPDVVHVLRQIATQLAGTAPEQNEGRSTLQALIEQLQPPADPAADTPEGTPPD